MNIKGWDKCPLLRRVLLEPPTVHCGSISNLYYRGSRKMQYFPRLVQGANFDVFLAEQRYNEWVDET